MMIEVCDFIMGRVSSDVEKTNNSTDDNHVG